MKTETMSWVGLTLANGRYEITRKLGEGGMGFVYQAHDRNLDTEVVIKVPRRAMMDEPGFADRFAREIRSLVRLVHPHIVKVMDVGEYDGLTFAVMQYLPGGSLRDRQPRDQDGNSLPLPARELRSWLEPIADALDFIHRQGYIHRDIKPDNILFDAEGHAFLSDFGIAKALADRIENRKATALTGTGTVLGTAHYMAPEVIMGQPVDGRVDQYGLAVMVYELLAGRCPFVSATPTALFVQHTTQKPPPLETMCLSVPRGVAAAVEKGLAKDPAGRYPDCASFSRAVLAGIGEMSVPVQVAPGSPLKLVCPSCRMVLAFPREADGKQVRCTRCGEAFRASWAPIPAPATRPAQQAVVETGPLPVSRPTSPRTEPSVRPTLADTKRHLPSPPSYRSRVLIGAALLAVVALGIGLFVSGAFSGRQTEDQPDEFQALKKPAKKPEKESGMTQEQGNAAQRNSSPTGRDSENSLIPDAGLSTHDATSFVGTSAGQERADNDLHITLCWCPPGTFSMGSPRTEEGRSEDEDQVEVVLKGFWIGKHEVTQSEWQKLRGSNPSWFSGQGGGKDKVLGKDTAQFPVESVSWKDAMEFCRRLTRQERGTGTLPADWEYNLPTEAQWEYACRAGTRTATAFGDRLSSKEANFNGNHPYGNADKGIYLERTTQVASYRPNAWGLFDMHGNVWEWCRDSYQVKLTGGVDPDASNFASGRMVLRGGSCENFGRQCRSAKRSGVEPGFRFLSYGFRLAAVPTAR